MAAHSQVLFMSFCLEKYFLLVAWSDSVEHNQWQSRQLTKARHGAEARKAPMVDFSDIISEFVKRKTRKMFY